MFKANNIIKGTSNNLALYDIFLSGDGVEKDVIGEFHKFFGRGFSDSQYPPTNTKKTANGYIIEMAIAGYKKEDVSVTQEDDVLTISANKHDETEKYEYIYKGISHKSFSRAFTLGKTSKVESVSLVDGLLTVNIVQLKPERKQITFELG